MLKNSMGKPLESGRPRVVWTCGARSTCPPRLWLATAGTLFPGYGTLWNAVLRRTPIFGAVYEASPLTFVSHPDSRWLHAIDHCPRGGISGLKNDSDPPTHKLELSMRECCA